MKENPNQNKDNKENEELKQRVNFKKMFLIGLTGGAATGKSTASGYFRELGVPVIDADEVAKLIVEPGQPAFNEIKATFGQEVIASTGKIVSHFLDIQSSLVQFNKLVWFSTLA